MLGNRKANGSDMALKVFQGRSHCSIYLFLQGGMPHHPTTTLWVTVALLCDSRVMHALIELSMSGDSESIDLDKLYSHNVNFTSIIMRHAD